MNQPSTSSHCIQSFCIFLNSIDYWSISVVAMSFYNSWHYKHATIDCHHSLCVEIGDIGPFLSKCAFVIGLIALHYTFRLLASSKERICPKCERVFITKARRARCTDCDILLMYLKDYSRINSDDTSNKNENYKTHGTDHQRTLPSLLLLYRHSTNVFFSFSLVSLFPYHLKAIG